MEPFTIQCSTCQSRIRVKSPKMIGKVANCPKCNSLVMITGPRQILVDRPDGPPVDSMAMTKDGIEPDFSALSETERSEEAEDKADDGYRLAPSDNVSDKSENNSLAAASIASEIGAETSWNPANELHDSPLLPSDEWASERSAKLRQYLLVGFLGISGVLLAVIGFFVFLRWYDSAKDPDKTQLASSNTGLDNAGGDPVAASQSGDAGRAEVEDGGASSAGEDQLDASNSGALKSVEGSQEQEASEAATAGEAAIAGDSVSGKPDTETDSVQPLEGDSAGETTQGESLSNETSELPPEFRTDEDGEGQTGGQEAAAVDPKQQVKESLPNEWLKQFAPMLEWEVVPTLPDTGAPLAPPPITAEDLGLASASKLDPITDVDWSEQAEVVLPGFILGESQPLSQAVNLWTHLSGMPTIVDLESLKAANRNPNAPPKLGKVTAASVRDVVKLLAERSNLEFDVKENRFLQFEARPDDIRAVLPSEIQFKDVLPGDSGQAWLQTALELFYPQPAEAWIWNDGSLSCDTTKVDLLTWFSVVRLLENLRSAAEKPLQVTEYQPQLLQQTLVDPNSLTQLDKRIAVVSPLARPVGQVLSLVTAQAGLQCWLDWPHVGSNGLGPSTTAVVVTYDRTLREILADYAEQFSLVVAIEDKNSLWITSPTAYRRQTKLFVMPSGGRTAEQIKQQLRDYTPLNEEGVGDLRAIATPDGQFVVARCCRPRLRL